MLEATDYRVKLGIPLEPNINHRQTVFGGSESAAAILSAWGLLWVRFRNLETRPKLVIRSNSMEYLCPIEGDFVAVTLPIEPNEWTKLVNGIERKGKGRIQIRSQLWAGGLLCGEFLGIFVALAN